MSQGLEGRSGYFSQYLNMRMNFESLTNERKQQLQTISELRNTDVLVYAASLNSRGVQNSIVFADLVSIQDQLSTLRGENLDLILETPGGFGEVAEDIVRLIRQQYDRVNMIIPGYAKSAGTIMALSGNEILMGNLSGLGPIDGQISYQGKTFSAHALLAGFEKIKNEVVDSGGKLNSAYIPMLQMISPGELQEAENVQNFSKRLVTDWLERYKFKDWEHHTSTGEPVTQVEKRNRANEIATVLCDHSKWLTHGRSIRLVDLKELGVRVRDYTEEPALAEAIDRYYTLLQLSFEAAPIYKVFETPHSQIYKFAQTPGIQHQPVLDLTGKSGKVGIDVPCGQCGEKMKVQADFGRQHPLDAGHLRFPRGNMLICAKCGNRLDLSGIRRDIEVQIGRTIIEE